MTKVLMPNLGMSMKEGTIAKWLKKEGDVVEKNEPILEITTEKLTNQVPAPEAGVLTKIIAQEGDVIACGEAIAEIQ